MMDLRFVSDWPTIEKGDTCVVVRLSAAEYSNVWRDDRIQLVGCLTRHAVCTEECRVLGTACVLRKWTGCLSVVPLRYTEVAYPFSSYKQLREHLNADYSRKVDARELVVCLAYEVEEAFDGLP